MVVRQVTKHENIVSWKLGIISIQCIDLLVMLQSISIQTVHDAYAMATYTYRYVKCIHDGRYQVKIDVARNMKRFTVYQNISINNMLVDTVMRAHNQNVGQRLFISALFT